MSDQPAAPDAPLRVVLFSGGRGSGALTTALVRMPGVDLTLAINGYDDGASTGEVRRFLGDALGPSDFRKNASRLATALGSCAPALVRLLDERLPLGATAATVATLVSDLSGTPAREPASVDDAARSGLAKRLQAFLDEYGRSGRPFEFADCAVGNLVFAGAYLLAGRQFNAAVAFSAAVGGVRAGVF
jgi:2-phospho-L-lactate transferase/gluconeogenesis factor (CofD/UPF0052 family)